MGGASSVCNPVRYFVSNSIKIVGPLKEEEKDGTVLKVEEKPSMSALRQRLRRLHQQKGKKKGSESKEEPTKKEEEPTKKEEKEPTKYVEKEKEEEGAVTQRVLMVETENFEHEPFEQTQEVKVMLIKF